MIDYIGNNTRQLVFSIRWVLAKYFGDIIQIA